MLIWKSKRIIYMLGQNDSFLKGNTVSKKYNSKNTIVFSNVTFWNNFFLILGALIFASINFRELVIFRIFARINFTRLQTFNKKM